jgi:hypothetical protein
MNRFSGGPSSIKLTKAQTRAYENNGPIGEEFRREARSVAQEKARKKGRSIEIYSHDGITFEQVPPPEES